MSAPVPNRWASSAWGRTSSAPSCRTPWRRCRRCAWRCTGEPGSNGRACAPPRGFPSHATQGSDARPAPVGAPDPTLQALAWFANQGSADPLRLPPRCLHIGPQRHGIAGPAGMKRCRRRMRRRSCPLASPAWSGAPCCSLRPQALPPTPARRAPAGPLLPQLHAGSCLSHACACVLWSGSLIYLMSGIMRCAYPASRFIWLVKGCVLGGTGLAACGQLAVGCGGVHGVCHVGCWKARLCAAQILFSGY